MAITLSDDDVLVHHKNSNYVSWVMQREPFSPYMVYKALCKIAVSIAGDKFLPLFEQTLKWLNPYAGEELSVSPAIVIETFTPGASYTACIYRLYIRDTNTVPHCLFWLAFGNYSLMTLVPTLMDFKVGALNYSS